MAEPLDRFLKCIERNASKFGNSDVNIVALQKEMMTFSPITLKYSEPETIFNHMPAIILVNLCKYCGEGKYRMDVLNAIKRVVTKDNTDEDTKIQLILLVHMTKMNIPIDELPRFYGPVSQMTAEVEMTDQLVSWKQLALKVIQHHQVNKTINNLMKENFGTEYSQRIADTQKVPVSVQFFATYLYELRGFAGINNIHINESHFQFRMNKHGEQLTINQRADAVLIDIATVTIHEYSHIRIRQVLDDMTSASLLASANASDPEFGRIAERAFFNVPIDWPKTLGSKSVSMTYVEEFLAAIREDSSLPVLINTTNLIERDGHIVMHESGGGADFTLREAIDFW